MIKKPVIMNIFMLEEEGEYLMFFRILTIRRHKLVTFCDAYSYDLFRQQLLIQNDLLEECTLKVGSVIDAIWHYDISKRGDKVISIDRITNIYDVEKNVSYKSFGYMDNDNVIDDQFVNGINGGVQLKKWKFKFDLISEVENELVTRGINRIYTPILTKYRGTSQVSPVEVNGKYIGKQYIKITHELELKKNTYMTLAPVFEIGYVARDRYETLTGKNEFLTLEGVLPLDHSFDLPGFYLQVLDKAKRIAEAIGLEYNKKFDHIEIIDVLEIYNSKYKEFTKEKYLEFFNRMSDSYEHVIFINAPLDSPLGLSGKEGVPLETQWNLNDHGIGHGYIDEYRIQKLLDEFYKQQRRLKINGIDAELALDYIKYCTYGAIPTYSFNLGIERFVEFFLESTDD